MTATTQTRSAYDCGARAAARGCYRVLCNPESPDEEAEWLRGYDSVPRSEATTKHEEATR